MAMFKSIRQTQYLLLMLATLFSSCLLAEVNTTVFADEAPTTDQLIDALSTDDGFPGEFKTRGLRKRQPKAVNQPPIRKAADLKMINFKFNSAALTSGARMILDRLGAALQDVRLMDARIVIEGHTDASGSRRYNQDLSERRANAVKNYLVAKHQIRASRLTAVGRGEDDLYDKQRPNSALNRRVVVINEGS